MFDRRKDNRRLSMMYQLWKEGPISRGQLAELMEMNLPTVSSIVQDLLKTGEIIEEGYATSTGGRKAQLVDINPNKGGVVAVEFSSKGILSAAADMKGRIHNHFKRPFSSSEGKSAAFQRIFDSIDEQIEFLRIDERLEPTRIGLVVSGLVDEENGISLKFPRFEEWENVALCDLIFERYQIPTTLSSHILATTLAESVFGRFRSVENGIYIHLGPGLGAGLIIDGEVHRGSKPSVGEFGHTTVTNNKSELCYCGNYGCLETLASDYALVQQAEHAIAEGVQSHIPEHIDESGRITPLAIFRAAEMGDRFALSLIDDTSHYLGTALANLINLLAPEMLVFGGTMVEEVSPLMKSIQKTIKRRALEDLEQDIQYKISSFGLQAGVVGAVAAALHHYYLGLSPAHLTTHEA